MSQRAHPLDVNLQVLSVFPKMVEGDASIEDLHRFGTDYDSKAEMERLQRRLFEAIRQGNADKIETIKRQLEVGIGPPPGCAFCRVTFVTLLFYWTFHPPPRCTVTSGASLYWCCRPTNVKSSSWRSSRCSSRRRSPAPPRCASEGARTETGSWYRRNWACPPSSLSSPARYHSSAWTRQSVDVQAAQTALTPAVN